jgi:hypothetical protein
MDSLFDCYSAYANDASLENALTLFLKIISEKSYKLYDSLSYARKGDNIKLCSNGSTGLPRAYAFGPNGLFWLNGLEGYLKQKHLGYTIALDSRFHDTKFTDVNPTVEYVSSPTFECVVRIDLRYDFTKIISILKEISDRKGSLNILTTPHTVLFMMTHPDLKCIINELVNIHIIRRLITINCDPFYPQKPYIDDTMINWQTGMNHYYCEYGNIHSLSLMSTAFTNLLNANVQKVTCDDMSEHSAIRPCACGRDTFDRHFIPHINNQISADRQIIRPFWIADNLKGNFHNLQFHQEANGDIGVYHSSLSKNITNDLDYIREYFTSIRLNTKLYANSGFMVGAKRPAFWSGNINKFDIIL